MAKSYSTSLFFKKVSKSLLQQYFNKKGILQGLDFSELDKQRHGLIDRWDELPDIMRASCESDFRDIYGLSNEKGMSALWAEVERFKIKKSKFIPDDDALKKHLDSLKGFEDRMIWVFLNRKHYWEGMTYNFIAKRSDGISFYKSHTIKPSGKLNLENIRQLQDAISEYYYSTQLRGKNCEIAHYNWNGHDYFFCYPEDYAQKRLQWDNKVFHAIAHIPAFEIIFHYHKEDDFLGIHALGGAKIIKILKELFAHILLDIEDLEEVPAAEEETINLNSLKSDGGMIEGQILNDPFICQPEIDTINSADIKKMVIRPVNNRHHDITIFSYRRSSPFHIEDSLKDVLNGLARDHRSGVPEYDIRRLRLCITYQDGQKDKVRTKSFDISTDGCCLGSSFIDQKIKEFLKRSGLGLSKN